jgi:hydrogenase expression/formation protein HypC
MCPVHDDGVAGPFPRGAAPHPARSAEPTVPECHDEVCITCSDQAVAVTVLRLLDDDLAVVDTGVGEEEVSVALVTAGVGDTILVHAREAIAVVGGDRCER